MPPIGGIQTGLGLEDRYRIDINSNISSLHCLNYIPNTPDECESVSSISQALSSSETRRAGDTAEERAINAANDLMTEADDLSHELQEGQWNITDPETDYEYVDPQFYVLYERLISIYNALQVLGMAIDALQGLKKGAIKSLAPELLEGGEDGASASETLSIARESGMLRSQGQLLEVTEAVWTHNQDLLQDRINDAKEQAEAEWYDYVSEVVTSGGSDSVQRHKDARAAELIYGEMQEYEGFQSRVQAEYERVLGNSSLYDDGLTGGGVFERLNWADLTVDIGAGKVDIDRDKLLANQMQLSGLENYRRLYFMLHSAIQGLKDVVVESATGQKHSAKVKQVLSGVLESLEKFESMVFSAMAYQLQSSIAAQNMRVDAYNDKELKQNLYYSSVGGNPFALVHSIFSGDWDIALATMNPLGGSLLLLGGLSKNISDYFALQISDSYLEFATSPSQLDMNRVYNILADLYGTSVDQIRNDINSRDKYIRELAEAERQGWEIVGRLSEAGIVYTGEDGYQGVFESRVNDLREQLVRIQNKERILIIGIEGLAKLKRIATRISTGLLDIDLGDDGKAAFKIGIENQVLAFDLKLAGIKNKVEAHNRKLQWEKTLEKAGWVALGSFVGMAVAAVLLIAGIVAAPFTGGMSVVAAIGFVAAMGQLGAALSQIVYNALNPVDDHIYDQTRFYLEARLQDNIERSYNQQIDRLDENSHVDAEDSSDPLSGGDQWVKDTELFMRVRQQMTRIYIYEQLLLMYAKAQQDLKSIATASLTGVYTGDNFDQARGASSSRFDTKLKAYELKESMVEDIISRRNMAVDQQTELNWAIVSAVISAISIATFGIGSSAGTEAARNAWGWANFGTDMAGMGAQATKNLLDATSGYDELGDYDAMKQAIDAMIENSFDSRSRDTLRAAMYSVNEDDMLQSVGRGQSAADGSNYYQGMRQIQLLYNRIIGALRVAEGIARIKARIAGAPTVGGASEAFEAEKASYLKQLDLLYERVQAYVERANSMADAWRDFTVSCVVIAMSVLLKVLNEKGLLNKLKKWASDETGATNKGIKITDPKTMKKAAVILTGEPNIRPDNVIGPSDLINIGIDLIISPNTMRFIAQQIFDANYKDDQEAAKADKVGTTRAALTSEEAGEGRSGSRIDQMDEAAYNNQLGLADAGVTSQAIEVDWELSNEFTKFLASEVEASADSVMNDSWLINPMLIKGKGGKDGAQGVAVPEDIVIDLSKKLDELDKVDWGNKEAVARVVKEIQELTAGSSPEKAQAAQAAAAAVAAWLVEHQKGNPKVQETLKAVVEEQLARNNTKRDVALTAYALAILGKMAPKPSPTPTPSPSTGTASAKAEHQPQPAVDQLILQVWQAEADDAVKGEATWEAAQSQGRETLQMVFFDRPEAVLLGHMTAEMLSSEAALRQEIVPMVNAVNWSSDAPDAPVQIAEKLQAIQKRIEEKTEETNLSLRPDRNTSQAQAAVLAAQAVAAIKDPAARQKAIENLEAVVRTASNEGLKVYAEAILARVQAKAPAPMAASAASPPAELESLLRELVFRVYARAEVMEGLATSHLKDERNPQRFVEQLESLKKEILHIIRQDAKAVGIELTGAPDEPVKLQKIIERIQKCATVEEMAAILQELSSDPAFVKVLPSSLGKYLAHAIETLKFVADKMKIATAAREIEKAAQANLASLGDLLASLADKKPGLSREVEKELKRKGLKVDGVSDETDRPFDSAVTAVASVDNNPQRNSSNHDYNPRYQEVLDGLFENRGAGVAV